MPSTSEYPRALYNHATRKDMIVHSAAQEAAVGEGWSRVPWQPLPPPEPKSEIQELMDMVMSMDDRIKALEAEAMLRAKGGKRDRS